MSALVTIAGLAILLLAVNAIVMLTMTRTAEMAASVESFLDSRAQTFE